MGKNFYHVNKDEIDLFAKSVAKQAKSRYTVIGKTNKDSTSKDIEALAKKCWNSLNR